MPRTVIPFRRENDETSALARFDLIAIELLAEGHATNLTAARLDAMLAELRRHREQLRAVMLDQRRVGLAEHAQFANLAASIEVAADQAFAQIDRLIAHAELQLAAQ